SNSALHSGTIPPPACPVPTVPPRGGDRHALGPGRLGWLPGHCLACTTPAAWLPGCATRPNAPAGRHVPLRPWFAHLPATPARAAAPFRRHGSSPCANALGADAPPSDRPARTAADGVSPPDATADDSRTVPAPACCTAHPG